MVQIPLLVLAYSAVGIRALSFVKPEACTPTAQWAAWSDIKHAFIFGDSYTQTGFDYTLSPPSPVNPLGNPEYPGWTSSNGPNWVDFLTTKYNASLLQTYNFAYGGATVDSDLVTPYMPTVVSVKQQVLEQFIPGYTGDAPTAPSAPAWSSADSVFAFWIGINDVGNTYGSGEASWNPLYAKIFDVYSGLVNELYLNGARNFVFINVPPVDRSPLTVGQGASSTEGEKVAIASWNQRIQDMATVLKSNDTEVNVWVYDSNKSFGEVLDDSGIYEQTAGLKNTTDYCAAYQNGTPEDNTLIASCGVAVNEYFWLNNLHPTYPIHDVVAQQVGDALVAGPLVC
ncbi:carbohydrate esterase family 16 protein [Xylariaceae sp. FL0662B]|nr:carbohydrate esterase family 16 protein [Xylariaceae sp. FL0662B]